MLTTEAKGTEHHLTRHSRKIVGYTPSPGDKHRQGDKFRGPVQERRECKTLDEKINYVFIINTELPNIIVSILIR